MLSFGISAIHDLFDSVTKQRCHAMTPALKCPDLNVFSEFIKYSNPSLLHSHQIPHWIYAYNKGRWIFRLWICADGKVTICIPVNVRSWCSCRLRHHALSIFKPIFWPPPLCGRRESWDLLRILRHVRITYMCF